MMKIRQRSSTRKRWLIALLILLCSSHPAFSQLEAGGKRSSLEVTIIKPQVIEVGSLPGQSQTQFTFSFPSGDIVYAPRKDKGSSLVLLIERKSSKEIRRASYDFEEYFNSETRPTDINVGNTYIIDPLISHDGRTVVFKHMISDQYYNIYSLDTASNELSKVYDEPVSYKFMSLSPDGSRLAFVAGGDVMGNIYMSELDREYYVGPLRLFVADLKSRTKSVVAESNYINGDLEWIGNEEVAYGAELDSKTEPRDNATPQSLNIYIYNSATKNSTLLIENAIMPHLSPDQQNVIFFGPPMRDTTVEWNQSWRARPPSGISLLSSDRKGLSRIAFEPVGRRYPLLKWLPDNIQFVSLRETSTSPNAVAQLRLWNVVTQNTRLLAELKAKDASKAPRSSVYPQFNIIGADVSDILVSTSEILGSKGNGLGVNVQNSVYSVNIASGEVKQELTAENILSLGYDIQLGQK